MFRDILRSVLIGLVVSLVLVLIFAIFVKFFAISDICIDVVNVIIKGLSTGIGCVFGIKEQSKGIQKGALIGLLYFVATYILFSLLNKFFDLSIIKIWDILVPVIFAEIFSICKVNKMSN